MLTATHRCNNYDCTCIYKGIANTVAQPNSKGITLKFKGNYDYTDISTMTHSGIIFIDKCGISHNPNVQKQSRADGQAVFYRDKIRNVFHACLSECLSYIKLHHIHILLKTS